MTETKDLGIKLQTVVKADEAEIVLQAAKADQRTVSDWIRVAIREKLARDRAERK